MNLLAVAIFLPLIISPHNLPVQVSTYVSPDAAAPVTLRSTICKTCPISLGYQPHVFYANTEKFISLLESNEYISILMTNGNILIYQQLPSSEINIQYTTITFVYWIPTCGESCYRIVRFRLIASKF